jgi:hypothetical protein
VNGKIGATAVQLVGSRPLPSKVMRTTSIHVILAISLLSIDNDTTPYVPQFNKTDTNPRKPGIVGRQDLGRGRQSGVTVVGGCMRAAMPLSRPQVGIVMNIPSAAIVAFSVFSPN